MHFSALTLFEYDIRILFLINFLNSPNFLFLPSCELSLKQNLLFVNLYYLLKFIMIPNAISPPPHSSGTIPTQIYYNFFPLWLSINILGNNSTKVRYFITYQDVNCYSHFRVGRVIWVISLQQWEVLCNSCWSQKKFLSNIVMFKIILI